MLRSDADLALSRCGLRNEKIPPTSSLSSVKMGGGGGGGGGGWSERRDAWAVVLSDSRKEISIEPRGIHEEKKRRKEKKKKKK